MRNIILTGLMGCGKTTVAKALSMDFKNFELIETDLLIEQHENMTINDIFAQKGENYFREIEKEIIDDILNKDNQIISLGGGSLNNNFDFEIAKKNSIIIYLKAQAETLYKRVKNDTQRPLLKCENPLEKLTNLLQSREENYLKADYTINVDNLSIAEITKKIEEIYTNE